MSYKDILDLVIGKGDWVYQEESFVLSAKIVRNSKYSIINDYIGRLIKNYRSDIVKAIKIYI